MESIINKINSELSAVKAHKGKNIVLTIKTRTATHTYALGNGVWNVEPTEEEGVLTLRNNKEYANKSTTASETTLTTTYKFIRTNIAVSEIVSFDFAYERDSVQNLSNIAE